MPWLGRPTDSPPASTPEAPTPSPQSPSPSLHSTLSPIDTDTSSPLLEQEDLVLTGNSPPPHDVSDTSSRASPPPHEDFDIEMNEAGSIPADDDDSTSLADTQSPRGTRRVAENEYSYQLSFRQRQMMASMEQDRRISSTVKRQKINHREHNELLSKDTSHPNLLNLASTIQNRIFTYVLLGHDDYTEPYQVRPDGKLVAKAIVRHAIEVNHNLRIERRVKNDGSPMCAAPGLLRASYDIRSTATNIFYMGNDFVLNIEEFNVKPLAGFWRRYSAAEIDGLPFLCDVTIPASPSGRPHGMAYSSLLSPSYLIRRLRMLGPVNKRREFVLRSRKRVDLEWGPSLDQGRVQLNVAYEPKWSSLLQWLQAFHQGEFPALTFDNCVDAEASDDLPVWLFQVINLFKTVKRYLDDPWEEAHRAVECQRGLMGPHWAEDGEEAENEPLTAEEEVEDPYADLYDLADESDQGEEEEAARLDQES